MPVESVTLEPLEAPAKLKAVTVSTVGAITLLGVPEITHVRELSESPVGKLGVTEQLLIAAPLLARVVGFTDMATPTLPLLPLAPI
jgi:hypothetical protein